ncbi:hypothetical protein [Mesorhizobium sp.]|uniref:hypothetical protein n=1 Tax=Mesorhizobium sp. TaxID=1871066 RepID=UPI00121C6A45|nr:hypothetical protein [Mesorhizobium sp.]TIL38514.1 MAG: hypothetical protein E5Y82_13510 [Mesorhizobium sp.]
MVDMAASVFRDFATDGVPSSGTNKPQKSKIREWGAYLESLANLSFSGKVYATEADLDADLVPAANSSAIVSGDGDNDGLYMKVGSTGVGSWTRLLDFVPGAQIVHAVDTGAGTPNAIVATSTIGLSASGSQIVRLDVFEANTGSPVTVAFNGGSVLTIKTASGNHVVAGGLAAGPVLGVVSDTSFRLLSDQASAVVLAGAEAASAAAIAARDIAAGYASDAVSQGFVPVYATAAGMSAITLEAGIVAFETRGRTAMDDGGQAIWAVRSVEPSHVCKITLGGGKWGEIIATRGEISAEAVGLKFDNSTDNGALWPGVIAYCVANGYRLVCPKGTMRTSVAASVTGDCYIRGAGRYATTFKAMAGSGITALLHVPSSVTGAVVLEWDSFQTDGSLTALHGVLLEGTNVITQGSYFRSLRGINSVNTSGVRSTMPLYSGYIDWFASAGKHGIHWKANACLNNSYIAQPRITNTTITGLHLENTGASIAELTVNSADIEGNNGAGVYVCNMRAIFSGATHLEGNGDTVQPAPTTLGANPFTTVSGSAIVTVAHTAHGLATGDEVNISGATAVATQTMNGKFVVTVVDANSYTIRKNFISTANASTTGGGSSVIVAKILPIDILVDSHDNIATLADFTSISRSTAGAGQSGVFALLMHAQSSITIRGGTLSRSHLIDGNSQASGNNINLPNCLAGTVNANAVGVRRDEPGIKKIGRIALGTVATATGISANSNGWVRVTATKRSTNDVIAGMYLVSLDNAGDVVRSGWIGPALPLAGFEDFVTFSVVSSQLMAARTGGTSDGWMTLEGEWREF